MDILAPWSLSSFIPLNSFHPLHRSLPELRAGDARIIVPKIPGYYEFAKLLELGIFRKGFDLPVPGWAEGLADKRMFHEFVAAHGAKDIWLQSNLSGDVELIHTAPVTLGERPFLMHCESFLPIFFPFFQQGSELEETKVDSIRTFYRAIFENPNCLGIASYMSDTLAQLSDFFQSGIIDGKLIPMPIGLDASYIAGGVEKSTETINFIFINSAHQDPRSFRKRGGICSLKLALQLLSERDDLVFYFRTVRPPDEMLAAHGIDVQALKRWEASRIIWIEHYLPDRLQINLIAKCHFMLLPSANLHSVSIMTALANGTVPIVTDTFGTEIYVEDMKNGVVIRGIRSAVWERNDKTRIVKDSHDRYGKFEPAVTASLIAKMRELLSTPDKIKDMANEGRKTIRQRFDGAAFASRLIEETKRRTAAGLKNSPLPRECRLAEGERWIEDISPAHFAGPPRPVARIMLNNGTIFQLGRKFIFVPRKRLPEFSQNGDWSPLRMAYEEFSPLIPDRARAVHAESLAGCIIRPTRVSFVSQIALILRPYKTLFAIARKAYYALRRLGVAR
jgi:glycosyltransferase involved in cell wall biosynthesis